MREPRENQSKEALPNVSDFIPPASTVQHPAAADLYLRHGWRICEIPFGQKGPTRTGWNREGGWITSTAILPPKFNIGLLHAFSGTCAIDIDHWVHAAAILQEHGIDLDQLYSAPDAVTIESGRPGRGKLLYEMPFPGFTLPSKKIVRDGQTILELRSGTTAGTSVQDVLPPSVHPETGQSYHWGGRGRWEHLPAIPTPLLDFWQEQLKAPERPQTPHTPAEWKEIKQALDAVPPDCDRETWLQVGMALHHEGTTTGNAEYAYQVFSEWSAGDVLDPPSNYRGQHDIDVTWRSMKVNHTDPVTIRTLFAIAQEHGWLRSMPDASHLFEANSQPIDVFEGLRSSAPSVDLNDVPKVLATRAQEIGDIVGCDPLVPLFAGLGAICAAVDARSRIKLADGYEEPPILWTCTIGEPAEKKSPGSRPMLQILRQIEREDLPRWKKAELEYKVQKDIYAKKYSEYLDFYANEGDDLLDNTVRPEEPYAPVEPHKLLMVVQDITSQKLMHHGAQQPRGVLCYLDEMNGWCKGLTRKITMESTSTWIAGFEGREARMDRVAAGELVADPFSVAVFGNIQPWVWREHLPMLSGDGFIARFLVAPLHSNLSKLPNPVPDELTSKSDYEGMIRHVYAAPRQTYELSPEAYNLFRQSQQWTLDTCSEERILAKDHLDKAFMYALGKVDGTIGRLAFVFHLAIEPLNPVVSADTMGMAIRFYRNYCLPALRYAYSEIGGVIVDSLDVWMAQHILAIAHEETVTMRNLKRSAKRRLEAFTPIMRTQVIIDAMMPLEDCGWVSLLESNPRTNEYLWAINPALKTVFEDYRRQVLTIRQKRLDENRKKAMTRHKGEIKRKLVPGYDTSWDN